MLHTNNGKYPLEEKNKNVIEYVSSLMQLEPSEELYLKNFYEGKYNPELLFTDKSILQNIQNHPIIKRTQQQIATSIITDIIKTNDFPRLISLKDEGFMPSPEAIKSIKESVPAQTMIAIQKIFSLPMELNGLENIKLAQSDSLTTGKNMEQSL